MFLENYVNINFELSICRMWAFICVVETRVYNILFCKKKRGFLTNEKEDNMLKLMICVNLFRFDLRIFFFFLEVEKRG